MKKATKREGSSKQSNGRGRKTWALMDYSFEICTVSDDVFLYDENESGALIVYIPVITNLLGIIPLRLCLTVVIIL